VLDVRAVQGSHAVMDMLILNSNLPKLIYTMKKAELETVIEILQDNYNEILSEFKIQKLIKYYCGFHPTFF